MKVSAIIPAYNAASMIGRAITSIAHQSEFVDEIIVVDDGSSDNTAQVAAQALPRVRVIVQENKGPSAARNAGLIAASNECVAFLDADDCWLPDKIGRQLKLLDGVNVSGVVTAFEKHAEGRGLVSVHVPGDESLGMLSPVEFVVFTRASPSTLLIDRRVTGDISFPEGVVEGEDPIFFGLVRSRGIIRSVDDVLAVRSMHDFQLTKRPGSFSRSIRNRLGWLEENWGELNIKSAEDARRLFWMAARDDVMSRFWARDFKAYSQSRAELLQLWPHDINLRFDLKRQVLPRWVYGFKDFIDSSMRRVKSMNR